MIKFIKTSVIAMASAALMSGCILVDDGYYDDDSYEEYYEESYTEYVWLSATGSKYHSKPDCGKMNPNTAYQIPLEEAQARNIQPCKNCH